jgi:hypothetical protein
MRSPPPTILDSVNMAGIGLRFVPETAPSDYFGVQFYDPAMLSLSKGDPTYCIGYQGAPAYEITSSQPNHNPLQDLAYLRVEPFLCANGTCNPVNDLSYYCPVANRTDYQDFYGEYQPNYAATNTFPAAVQNLSPSSEEIAVMEECDRTLPPFQPRSSSNSISSCISSDSSASSDVAPSCSSVVDESAVHILPPEILQKVFQPVSASQLPSRAPRRNKQELCHKRIHFCSEPGCNKVYTKSSHLKAHQRLHTGNFFVVHLVSLLIESL